MDLSTVEMVDHYELGELIGQGGMSDVFRAIDVKHDKTVALKMLYKHLLQQPNSVERFSRIADVMLGIRHSNIIRIYDYVCRPDLAYFAMEYLEGGTLQDKLHHYRARVQSVSLSQTLEWILPICGAVHYAHEQGLVHRDLKPSNILFRSSGSPVLTDFGLAFLLDQPRLSGSNTITGTPGYLSPEQAQGLPGARRSDVYSLGILLYEMLTGRTPFDGSAVNVILQHVSEPPMPPSNYRKDLPKPIEKVVLRALEKAPHHRYRTAAALGDALKVAYEHAALNESVDQPAVQSRSQAQPSDPVRHSAPVISNPGAPRKESGMSSIMKARAQKKKAASKRISIVVSVVMFACLVALAWWGFTASSTGDVNPATVPRFGVGTLVRVSVPDRASISVLQDCPGGPWKGVLGVVLDGEQGFVRDRKGCDEEWWYSVELIGISDPEWDGVGWVHENYLRP
jgi:eukaryotic-like serine/threonine-protein kinase